MRGGKRRRQAAPKVDPQLADQIRFDCACGYLWKELWWYYGISHSTLWRIVKRLGAYK
jgi:hypothetical protein